MLYRLLQQGDDLFQGVIEPEQLPTHRVLGGSCGSALTKGRKSHDGGDHQSCTTEFEAHHHFLLSDGSMGFGPARADADVDHELHRETIPVGLVRVLHLVADQVADLLDLAFGGLENQLVVDLE